MPPPPAHPRTLTDYGRTKPCRFMGRQKSLYDFLYAASLKKTVAGRRKPRADVARFVFRDAHPLRLTARLYNRLRQIQWQVNRRLEESGDRRRIKAPRYGYLALIDPQAPTPPASPPKPPKLPKPRKRLKPTRPTLSLVGCGHLIRELLAQGCNRSADIQREVNARGASRRTYFAARAKVGVVTVRRREDGRWRWFLEIPPPESGPEEAPI